MKNAHTMLSHTEKNDAQNKCRQGRNQEVGEAEHGDREMAQWVGSLP